MLKKKERPYKRIKNSVSRHSVKYMTRKQFEELPYRGNWNTRSNMRLYNSVAK